MSVDSPSLGAAARRLDDFYSTLRRIDELVAQGGDAGEGPVTKDAEALAPAARDAIAGDYNLNFRANAEEADGTAAVRFTVEASLLGALIGGALIIGAFVGLWWVFRRYGRR